MAGIAESLERSLSVAVELGNIDVDEHAGTIAGARAAAAALDAIDPGERGYASMLSSYLNYCKALGIVPNAVRQSQQVVGDGRLASMRSTSRARLRAV